MWLIVRPASKSESFPFPVVSGCELLSDMGTGADSASGPCATKAPNLYPCGSTQDGKGRVSVLVTQATKGEVNTEGKKAKVTVTATHHNEYQA
jgi:hypothetical protein